MAVGIRRAASVAWAFLLLATAGCATDLVVRAPQERAERGSGALAGVAPLDVTVPAVRGDEANDAAVGRREGGLGRAGGSVALTEPPGDVVRRVVVQELRAAGHRVVERDGDAAVEIHVRSFQVEAPRAGSGWDVDVKIKVALRVQSAPGAGDWSEFVYTAERNGHSVAPPGVGTIERILGEAVADLGTLIAERAELARALDRYGHGGSRSQAPALPRVSEAGRILGADARAGGV